MSAAAAAVGPLSFAQEEIVDRMCSEPECAPRYDLARLLELRGDLRPGCLADAIGDVVRRHPTLRTTIEVSGGDCVQRVHDAPLGETRRRAVDPDGIDRVATDAVERRLGTPALLAGEPLFRAELAQVAGDRHLLALNVHHCVFDGLSFPVLWRDLAECYAARLERRRPSLPPLRSSYLERAIRERREWPRIAARAIPFWRAIAGDAPRRLRWPRPGASDPRPADRWETRALSLALPAASLEAVRAAARAARVPPYLVLLSATAMALARASGQDDLVLGSDFTTRDSAAGEHAIGMFVNTRLTRVRLSPGQSVAELVPAVRRDWLAAEEHRDAPLDLVLRAIGLPEGRAHLASVPLNPPLGALRLAGLEVEQLPLRRRDRYWRELTVTWSGDASGYTAEVRYRPSCVADGAARAVVTSLDELLAVPARRPVLR